MLSKMLDDLPYPSSFDVNYDPAHSSVTDPILQPLKVRSHFCQNFTASHQSMPYMRTYEILFMPLSTFMVQSNVLSILEVLPKIHFLIL